MSELVSSLKEQGKAIMVMMGIAIISILAMIVLDFFSGVVKGMSGLGTGAGSVNLTVTTALNLFIVAFGLTGSFASITMLIIVVKVVIGVVRGLKT